MLRQRASGLWVAQPEPIVPVTFGLSGHVSVSLRRAKSGTLLKSWKFRNLITDTYLDALMGGTPTSLASCYIGAGTGTTAPANNDTALASEIAPAATNRSNSDLSTSSGIGYNSGSPDYVFYTLVRDFTTSQANGTIGELGIFTASSAGSCYARCLPKDINGNVTTIAKTSASTMNVSWQIRMTPIQGDVADSVVINGVTYTLTYRAAKLNATVGQSAAQFIASGVRNGWSNAALQIAATAQVARTASPAAGTAPSVYTVQPYTSGTFTRDIQAKWAATQANVVLMPTTDNVAGSACMLQVAFSPVLAAAQTATFRASLVRS